MYQFLGKEIEAEQYYELCCNKYKVCHGLYSDDASWFFFDWGRALFERAKLKGGTGDSAGLLLESCEKFSALLNSVSVESLKY